MVIWTNVDTNLKEEDIAEFSSLILNNCVYRTKLDYQGYLQQAEIKYSEWNKSKNIILFYKHTWLILHKLLT